MATFEVLSETPCPRCLPLVFQNKMWLEGLGRLREDKAGPTSRDGSGKCCDDCRAADALLAGTGLPTWSMARVAVGNDRCEQLRLPGAPMGLVLAGYMRPSRPGDFQEQQVWLVRASLVKEQETPCDAEVRWQGFRHRGSERVRETVEATGTCSCYACGEPCDLENDLCFGCGEAVCEACDKGLCLMGNHDVEDHLVDFEEEYLDDC